MDEEGGQSWCQCVRWPGVQATLSVTYTAQRRRKYGGTVTLFQALLGRVPPRHVPGGWHLVAEGLPAPGFPAVPAVSIRGSCVLTTSHVLPALESISRSVAEDPDAAAGPSSCTDHEVVLHHERGFWGAAQEGLGAWESPTSAHCWAHV